MNHIIHEYTRNIVCPYCGYENLDSWDVDVEVDNETEMECGCGKEFAVYKDMDITYVTRKKE